MENLVSIIVPIYNAEQYLKECIGSLINQSYANIEIILINDGSSDKSLEICTLFGRQDQRIKIIDKINEGVGKTRNRGITEATGEYIIFVDADDYIHQSLICHLISEIKNSKADIVVTGFNKIDSFGKLYKYRMLSESLDIKESRNLILKEIIGGRGGGSPVGKLYIKDIIDVNKILFPVDISNNEDVVFNLAYILNCSTAKISNQWFYYYRVGHSSNSNRYISNWLKQAQEIQNRKKELVSDEYADYLDYSWCILMINGIIIEIFRNKINLPTDIRANINYYLLEINSIPGFPKKLQQLYPYPDHRLHFKVIFLICSIFPLAIQKRLMNMILIMKNILKK